MTRENNDVKAVETKAFYKSKIVWLAVATIFLGATEQFAVLGDLLPAEYQGIFTMIVGFLTLLARTVTGTAIAVSSDTK